MTDPQRCALEDIREEVTRLLDEGGRDFFRLRALFEALEESALPPSPYADNLLRPGLNSVKFDVR